jgi:hypothetical protein
VKLLATGSDELYFYEHGIVGNKRFIIDSVKLLDGVCVFTTNHIEQQQGRGFKAKPLMTIRAYRDKTKIEDVFKNVKSSLKSRPFLLILKNMSKQSIRSAL